MDDALHPDWAESDRRRHRRTHDGRRQVSDRDVAAEKARHDSPFVEGRAVRRRRAFGAGTAAT